MYKHVTEKAHLMPFLQHNVSLARAPRLKMISTLRVSYFHSQTKRVLNNYLHVLI
jgi:hypothetical protein